MINELRKVFLLLLIVSTFCYHREIDMPTDQPPETPTINSGPILLRGVHKNSVDKKQTKESKLANNNIYIAKKYTVDHSDLKRGFVLVSEMKSPVQKISLARSIYRQGDVAHLMIESSRQLNSPRVRFLGRNFQVSEKKLSDGQGRYYEAFLPVPINADTGQHTLTLTYTNQESGEENKRLTISIIEGEFREADTSEVDLPMLSEEMMALVRYEHRFFARGYWNGSKKRLWEGNFIWPASGKITSTFGISRKYNEGKDRWLHKAIDIAAYVGARVVASNSGIIAMVEDLEAHGKSLMIDHGAGVFSIYLHMDTIFVEKGDTVKIGQKVGKMGDTGLCTGPNLHWQVMVNGVATDPRQWLAVDEMEKKKGSFVKSQRPSRKK